jgi:hypothetical protein
MGMFERVATSGLDWLFLVLLYANAFRAVPASPANECGADLYPRVVLTHHYLLLTALAAGTLFLVVRTAARDVEAAAKAIGADHVHEGIGSVTAEWKRRLLRGTLLLAVALSFAASILAEITFEKGFLHRAGCGAYQVAYGLGSPTYGSSRPGSGGDGYLRAPPRVLRLGGRDAELASYGPAVHNS